MRKFLLYTIFGTLFLFLSGTTLLKAQEVTLKADFSVNVSKGRPPLTVRFSDQSNGNPNKWTWDFGDGTTSSEQNPVHTYYSCGVYTVVLVVSNDTATYSIKKDSLITVKPEPASRVIYSTTKGGNWVDGTTWEGGIVPTASDDVVLKGNVVAKYGKYECNNLIILPEGMLSSASFNGSYSKVTVHGDLCNKGKIAETQTFVLNVEKKLINDGSIGYHSHLARDHKISLYLNGDLINNGQFDDSNEGQLRVYAKGNIINRGKWHTSHLYLNNDTTQIIYGDSVFVIGYFQVENGQKIVAGTSLYFEDSYLRFQGSIFEIPSGKTVSLTKVNEVYNYISAALIQGGGILAVKGGYTLGYGSSIDNIQLKGDVDVAYNFYIKSKVSFDGTMKNKSGKYPNVYFQENFANNGEIIDNTNGGNIYLHIEKNVTNNGKWQVKRTFVDGTSDQTIQDNKGLSVDDFILKANVSGASAYQWYKDNKAIDGATNYTYYVKTDTDYAGDYYCKTDQGDSRKITLKKSNAALAADFIADKTSGTAPLTVQFTDQSSGNITGWSWDFGDGETSTEQNPQHIYTSAGKYTVKLTVNDGTNTDEETKTGYITVTSSTGGGTLLKEHFDSETFPPAGWTQKITNTAKTWMKGNPSEKPFTDIDPTNVYSALCPYVAEDQDEWLKSPAFDLPDGILNLEFYAGYNSYWVSNATLNVYISTNNGTTWDTLWNASMVSTDDKWAWNKIDVDLSAYAGKSGIILAWQYVGNDGDLIAVDNVEVTQGTTGIDDLQASVDRLLMQNYPNPFRTQTRIAFILEQSSNVKLVVYNSLGQPVAMPVSGVLRAGKHEVLFNGSSLRPGIYYYRLILDGKSMTRRMVIMK